jgi:hypothetical protein
MARCNFCEEDMLKVDTCKKIPVAMIGDPTVILGDPIPYGSETRYSGSQYWPPQAADKCHDCGAVVGGFHHPGCDMEECPKCRGQLISCGCLGEE